MKTKGPVAEVAAPARVASYWGLGQAAFLPGLVMGCLCGFQQAAWPHLAHAGVFELPADAVAVGFGRSNIQAGCMPIIVSD